MSRCDTILPMNIRILCLIILLLSTGLFSSCNAPEQRGEVKEQVAGHVPDVQETSSDEDVINPHFTGRYCDLCHSSEPRRGGETFLMFNGDFNELCKCHNYTSDSYIHPVNVTPSDEKLAVIPREFPLPGGKITCLTCHDMYEQCRAKPEFLDLDKVSRKFYRTEIMFLRGAPYRLRTDICFRCHDEERYRPLNPHKQIDAFGEIIVEKCLYCHVEKPDEKTASFKDVILIGDLKLLCQRCHDIKRRHPANVNHFRRPSNKMFKRLKALEAENGITMPLDSEGKIFCATCHNPHERGVIPSGRPGAKGAGSPLRHRLPGKLCSSCHGM